jgi:seryl-tRNA synthetase
MLSRDLLRDDAPRVRQGLLNRQADPTPLDAWQMLDAERRTALGEAEELKRQRNEASRAIGEVK